MRCLTIGTAGHIDHGKTTLVRALTGIDTDRLPEEKQRGITIDLGFARLPLGDDLELDIVDVPGHEAFVRNMLAGATGIDMALLVVAADEGVMPQTREHLAILELLGVERAVMAITKIDAAEAEWLDLVREDVADLLADSPLAGSPVVPVSARTGQGLAALRAALRAGADHAIRRPDEDIARLPIDRVFTVRGTGTVVTGTLWSGALQVGDSVRVEPGGLTARVRGLQRHGADVSRIGAGERGAVALAGAERSAIGRGDTLVSARQPWPASLTLTVKLACLRGADGPLATRQRVRVHIGTAEVLGRLALADGVIKPGESGLGQLRLEAPLLARAGDRVVLRAYSPVATIAGGTVIEPLAARRKRWPEDVRAALDAVLASVAGLEAVLDLAGPRGVDSLRLPLLLPPGGRPAGDQVAADVGGRLVRRTLIEDAQRSIARSLAEFHQSHPIESGVERDALRRAAGLDDAAVFDAALQEALRAGAVLSHGAIIAAPGHAPQPAPTQLDALAQLRTVFEHAGLELTAPEALPAALARRADLSSLIRFLEREGSLVRAAPGLWMGAEAASRGVAAIRTQLPPGQPLGVAQFRDVLGLSRKHLLPLLEYFDAIGITRRMGDERVLLAGPAPESIPLGSPMPGSGGNGPDSAPAKS
jgi:selenocysteine-specific elongation factor